MKIASTPDSSIDYEGKFGPVFFTSGCNFRCGFCQNSELINGNGMIINNEKLKEKMKNIEVKAKRGWYTGACISGGEPTLQSDLLEFARKLKDIGLAVKLDTNGSKPEVLENLLNEKVVDYVAMDVKGPDYLYNQLSGVDVNIKNIEKSMRLLTNSGIEYEFRTTVVPVIRNNEIKFLTSEEAKDMAGWIVDVTGNNKHKYYLQKFVPTKGSLLDKRLEEFEETPDELMEKIYKTVKTYLPNTRIR